MKSNKKITTILIGIVMLAALFSGTLAAFRWITSESQRTDVVFTVSGKYSCAADGGGDIASASLMPASCTNITYAIQREITVTPTLYADGLSIEMDLWLNIDELGEGLSQSEYFRYALTTNENSCTDGIVSEGTFHGLSKENGDRVKLLDQQIYRNSTPKTYYLYIWIDPKEENNIIVDQPFSFSLGGSCNDTINVEAPVLDDGMVPVVISSDGKVKTIASDDGNWYNYQKKEWANIVLVKENVTSGVEGSKSREYYLANPGTPVVESDILAYYVWIPRYKYKIWTTGLSTAGQEQPIEIAFESLSDEMSLGTKVDEYRTHPAFWWDNDNDSEYDDGEMLPGIWVGKFETTGSAATPTVKPNTSSLVNQNVSTQFITSLKFAGGSMNTSTGKVTFGNDNIYNLTTKTDSHMMKNSEWGAVAYLSHSSYGINEEVRINNYNNNGTLTGCGALTKDEVESTTCGIEYGKPSTEVHTYPQSTTGNITGIFDMSGGSWEAMMSNYNKTTGSSEFTTYPDGKYYDLYASTDVSTACNSGICYGQALSETNNWFDDLTNSFTTGDVWFYRGGVYNRTINVGVFAYAWGAGVSTAYHAFRSVLIPNNNYTLTFNAKGGILSEGQASKNIAYGFKYGELPIPTKDNYAFDGWYTQLDGGDRINSDTIVNIKGNQTLYAHWKSINMNISYSVNGGTIKSSTADGNTTYAWSTNNDDMIHLNNQLYTSNISDTQTVNLPDYNDNNFMNITRDEYGVVENKEWICLSGCKSNGLVFDQSATYSVSVFCDGKSVDCNVVLGVNWSQQYTITYNLNGGSGEIEPQIKTHGIATNLTSDKPEKEGYSFLGWSTEKEAISATYESGDEYTDNRNITLYAIWKLKAYMITYNLMGGSDGPDNIEVNHGDKITLSSKIPIKTGYTFNGWNTLADGSGTSYTVGGTYTVSANLFLYAKWLKNYTITYNANGGSGAPASQTKVHGTAIKLSTTVPTRAGYKFVGWSTSSSATSSTYDAGSEYTSNASATLYAVWLYLEPMTVSLNSQGGEFDDTKISPWTKDIFTVTQSGEHIFTAPYSGEYRLEVWGAQGGIASSTRGGYGGYSTGVTEIEENAKMYIYIGGQGDAGRCTTTRNGGYNGGGSVPAYSTSTVKYVAAGGGATHISITNRGELKNYNSYKEEVIIVAGGGGGSYQHSTSGYYGEGGDGGGARGVNGKVNNGAYFGLGGSQTAAGYASGMSTTAVGGFGYGGTTGSGGAGGGGGGGWYGGGGSSAASAISNSGGGGGSGYIGNNLLKKKYMYCYSCEVSSDENSLTYSTTNVSATPLTNYAKSGVGAAKITSLDVRKTVEYQNEYGYLPEPTKIGYIFDGWYTEPIYGVKVDSTTLVENTTEHTLYAHWLNDVSYTITYDANGGSEAPKEQIKYDGIPIIITTEIPNRSNYALLGWSTDKNATTPTYTPGGEFTVNENTTLYAVWTKFAPLTSYKCANGAKGSSPYSISYTGNCSVIDDGNGNWRIKFLSNGTLTSVGSVPLDVFLVGGGGGGGNCSGAGGGGGYTKTERNTPLSIGETQITIGGGGGGGTSGGNGSFGGTSKFGKISVEGGSGGTYGGDGYSPGGSGGSGGGGAQYGSGGSDGGNGGAGSDGGPGGEGQGSTTREFGESTGTLYSGGGGAGGYFGGSGAAGGSGGGGAGASYTGSGVSGTANTGGGGGGGGWSDSEVSGGSPGNGGSGIVVIRNKR